jgi:hypothetical protein
MWVKIFLDITKTSYSFCTVLCCVVLSQGYYPPLPLSRAQPLPSATAVPPADKHSKEDTPGLEQSPSWLTDEKLNQTDSDTDEEEVTNNKDEYDDGLRSNKRLKTARSISGPIRASSLTSNAVYSYDASEVFAAHKVDPDTNASMLLDATQSAAKLVPSENKLDQVNDRKRQRQIQLQKHSVVFSKSKTGPTASYMGVCRLPEIAGSTGTRSEHRYRRVGE